jgi:hypothetical protein
MRPGGTRPRPGTAGRPVIRKVDCRGDISFAGTSYRVGNPFALKQVEVRVVGLDTGSRARQETCSLLGAFG